jgi:hypothetical protein
VIIDQNLIFNSNQGITFSDTHGLPYSVENAVIRRNLLYDIGHRTNGDVGYASLIYDSKNVSFQENTYVHDSKHRAYFRACFC